MKNDKIKKNILLLTTLSLIVTLSSICLIYATRNQYAQTKNLTKKIEEEWRSNTKRYLEGIQTNLEFAVHTDHLNIDDDDDIYRWITDHTEVLFTDNEIENVSVISLGYSVNKDSVELNIDLDTQKLLPDDIKDEFETAYKVLVNNLENNEVSSKTLNNEIDSIAKKISEACDLPHASIKSIIIKNLLESNKVIFSLHDIGNEVNPYDCSYSYKNKEEKEIWVESVLIPDGVLGFNNEAPYVNGEENLNYKKILVTIAVPSDSILKPYVKYMDTVQSIVNISVTLLAIITVSSIIVIIIIFKNMLQFNNMIGGEINAVKNYSNTDDVSNS